MAGLKHATATSAGGIVIGYEEDRPRFVAGRRHREPDSDTWTLPKGTPDPGESTEQTALREVTEETGLRVRIVEPLESISYTFVQRGARIHKTVHYFLMVPTGGDLAEHDHEFEEVRWVDLDDAAGLLTFESERGLVAQAAGRIAALPDGALATAVGQAAERPAGR